MLYLHSRGVNSNRNHSRKNGDASSWLSKLNVNISLFNDNLVQ